MSEYWHWRNSMRSARFFDLDARSAIPLVAVMVHFRSYTIGFALLIIGIFYLAERWGLTFSAALRFARMQLAGLKRPNIVSRDKRKRIDYG